MVTSEAIQRELVKKMVAEMAPAELRDYLTYRQGPGYPAISLSVMSTAEDLHKHGWLSEKPRMWDPKPIYLSYLAWSRFALDEWDQVEQEAIVSEVKDVFGEW